MIYIIIKSFYLSLICNYGDDQRLMEILILIIGMLICPILNLIYVF